MTTIVYPPNSADDHANHLYVAFCARPGDVSGLQYWSGRIANEGLTDSIINSFASGSETQALYGGSVTQNVTALYQNLFNRSPDQSGLDYYVGQINTGAMTFNQVAWQFAHASSGDDGANSTAKVNSAFDLFAYMNTRSDKGQFYTIDKGRSYLAGANINYTYGYFEASDWYHYNVGF